MQQLILETNSVYRFNLYDEIESFTEYDDFIKDLALLSENDAVALYINSPGGRIDIGVSLVNTVRSCQAKVTAVIEGPSYSMASILALACDGLIMLDNTFLMYHNYSTMSYGKGGELMASLTHSNDHFNKLMTSICSPFLTKAELKDIQNDRDIYIYHDDSMLAKRKERHFK